MDCGVVHSHLMHFQPTPAWKAQGTHSCVGRKIVKARGSQCLLWDCISWKWLHMQDPDSDNSAERGKLLDTPQEDKEMQVVNDRCERFGSSLPGTNILICYLTQSSQTLKSHKRKQQTRTQQSVSLRLSLPLFPSIYLNYHLSSPISLSSVMYL